LKLKVNTAESAVDRPSKRTFLGFSFTSHIRTLKIRIPAEYIKGMKGNLKKLFRQGGAENWGVSSGKTLTPNFEAG